MRSYHLTAPGIASLRMVEQETPVPGAGEVLVRMRAASLNYRDLLVARAYKGSKAPGLVPLSDGAGEVVALGPGVRRFAKGDLVASCFHPRWIYGEIGKGDVSVALGGGSDGVLTEFRLFHEDSITRVPAGLSAREAATLPCAALTAWNAVGACTADDTILVLGTGGVSIFALQFAKAAGARVLATSSSDEKIARLRALGADGAVNYVKNPEWDKAIVEMTGGRGVDCVVEVVGGSLAQSIAAVRPGGEVALIGVLTGGQIDPSAILFSGASVRGIMVGSRAMFEAMNMRIVHHGIRPVIDRVFAYEQAADAYWHLEKAGHFGKVVIDIG